MKILSLFYRLKKWKLEKCHHYKYYNINIIFTFPNKKVPASPFPIQNTCVLITALLVYV